MYPAAPPPPPPPQPPAPPVLLWRSISAAIVLGVVATVLGLLRWPRPVWSPSSAWMVTDVPAQLWAVILGVTVVCLGAAIAVSRRAVGLHLRDVSGWAWLAVVLLAAAALVWNAVYAAALSTIDFGAPIPIFHWLFTFAPAVLAGLLFRRRDRRVRWAAALGSGVVTVPLFALSWALLWPGLSAAGLVGTLVPTVVLGVAPLAGGVALAGTIGWQQPPAPRPGLPPH